MKLNLSAFADPADTCLVEKTDLCGLIEVKSLESEVQEKDVY
jgi:hypothetical protein